LQSFNLTCKAQATASFSRHVAPTAGLEAVPPDTAAATVDRRVGHLPEESNCLAVDFDLFILHLYLRPAASNPFRLYWTLAITKDTTKISIRRDEWSLILSAGLLTWTRFRNAAFFASPDNGDGSFDR
jgi:hypothetical protein